MLIDDQVLTIPEVRQLVEEKITANPKLSFGIKVSRVDPYHIHSGLIETPEEIRLTIPVRDCGNNLCSLFN